MTFELWVSRASNFSETPTGRTFDDRLEAMTEMHRMNRHLVSANDETVYFLLEKREDSLFEMNGTPYKRK